MLLLPILLQFDMILWAAGFRERSVKIRKSSPFDVCPGGPLEMGNIFRWMCSLRPLLLAQGVGLVFVGGEETSALRLPLGQHLQC